MNCPKCDQPVDPGALYCGNCGQRLEPASSPIAAVMTSAQPLPDADASPPNNYAAPGVHSASGLTTAIPQYAVTTTHTHNHVKIILSIVFGALGIAAAFFLPLAALIFGVSGIVLATTATQASGRWFKIAALVLSIGALLCGLATWAYIANNNPKLHPSLAQKAATPDSSKSAITAIGLTTPCYSLTFPVKLNIDNVSGSCEMNAFNGKSIEASSNAYKVLTSSSSTITSVSFQAIAQKAIENDISQNLPGFTITAQGNGTFSGSQAYFVNAANATSGVAVEEAAVLHSSASGPELFVLVHITFGTSTNLSGLESHWQWK